MNLGQTQCITLYVNLEKSGCVIWFFFSATDVRFRGRKFEYLASEVVSVLCTLSADLKFNEIVHAIFPFTPNNCQWTKWQSLTKI